MPRVDDGLRTFARRRAMVFAATLFAVLVMGTAAIAALRPKVDNPHGADFREECALCHSADGWKPAKVSPRFDHGRYGFRLDGAHAAATCMNCHTSLQFKQSKTQCQSCHEDVHRGEMGVDCARCHGARSFTDRAPMVRAHQMTSFPLTGGHASLDCESCHQPAAQGRMQFVNTKAECQSCHMDQYRSTRDPDHAAGGFPTTCQTCHSTLTWSAAKFNHDRTAFPLTGSHRATACQSCHANGQYVGTSTACQSCHLTDYNGATPNHPASGFSAAACATCHNTTTFTGATFDHNSTSFPLTGAHRAANCQSCHSGGVYDGLDMQCQSCHMTDYNSATPNHPSAGFAASACATCHGTTTWSGATFNHNNTSFPLTGSHVAAACASCHASGVYNGLDGQCQSCHMTDYNSATPNHVSAGFSASACATCHGTTTWAGATFNHDQQFFPIYSGKHRSVWGTDCATCHSNSQNYAVFDCLSCHEHNRTDMDDKHRGRSGYSYDSNACYRCHPTGRS